MHLASRIMHPANFLNSSTLTLNAAIQKSVQILNAAGIVSARLDAELLLSHVLKKDRTWVFTHAQDRLDPENEKTFQDAIGRRAGREPLQYILGTQEFFGLVFTVTPDVLIPRPETEFLAEAAIGSVRTVSQPMAIDLCTGSGCIAVALATSVEPIRIFATDISERALAVARENARRHRTTEHIRFLHGDLFTPLHELDLRGRIDVITANPPYIPSGDLASLQPEVRDFEPETALIAGTEGTEFHERIIREASLFLKKQGALVMEMGIGQADALARMSTETGAYEAPKILKDLAGIERIIVLQRKQ